MNIFDIIENIMEATKKRWGEDKAETIFAFSGIVIVLFLLKVLIADVFYPFYLFLTESGVKSDVITVIECAVAFVLLIFSLIMVWRGRRLISRFYKQTRELVKETEEKSKALLREAEEENKKLLEESNRLIRLSQDRLNELERLLKEVRELKD